MLNADQGRKSPVFFKKRNKWRSVLSDPGEIVHSVYDTYPGERNLGYADMTSAKWLTEDVISFIYKRRKAWLESWFNVTVERVQVCRHNNFRSLCRDCGYRVKETLEYVIAHAPKSIREVYADDKPRLRKRPGGENL